MGVRSVEWTVRLAVMLLPTDLRTVRREEWLADLASCEELQIPPRQILIGAVLSAARTRATRPNHSIELERGNHMTESAKSALRLVLYCAWVAIAGAVTWVMATQAATYLATGSGPGYSFGPRGPYFDTAIPMLVVAVVVLMAGVALGVRSFAVNFLAGPRRSESSELLPGA